MGWYSKFFLFLTISLYLQCLSYAFDFISETKYSIRTSPEDIDQDVYQYIKSAGKLLEIGKGDIRYTVNLRAARDMDKRLLAPPLGKYYVYNDLLDVEQKKWERIFDGNLAIRIYTAYVELYKPIEGVTVKLGRQRLRLERYSVPQDGGLISITPTETVQLEVFGGRPFSYYLDTEGFTSGGKVTVKPLDRTKISVFYAYVNSKEKRASAFSSGAKKDEDLGRVSTFEEESFQNNYIAVRMNQGIGRTRLEGIYSHIDKNPYEGELRVSHNIKGIETLVNLSGLFVLSEIERHSYFISPFSGQFGALKPSGLFSLSGTKRFGAGESGGIFLTAEVERKELWDDAKSDLSNFDFTKLGAKLEIWEYPVENISGWLEGDFWVAKEREIVTGSLGVSKVIGNNVNLECWGGYYLYKFDVVNNKIKENVGDIVGSVDYKAKEWIGGSLYVRNEFGDGQLPYYEIGGNINLWF